jgi:hypothetical protein
MIPVRSRQNVISLAAVVMTAAALTHLSGSQALPGDAADFVRLSTSAKETVLNRLAIEQLAVAPDQLSAIVQSALLDGSPVVRERAARVIGARAGSPRDMAAWRQERTVYALTRPRLLLLMQDADVKVRDAATGALCSIDIDFSDSRVRRTLSLDTARAIASRLAVESSESARARVLSVFGNYDVPMEFYPERDAVLRAALADVAPIAQSAIVVVWNKHVATHLPAVAKLLAHSKPEIRVVAAQAVSSFGRDAQPYVTELERALATETDDIARKTIEGALRKVRG